MEINKGILTIETGGVCRCCLLSLKNQISLTVVTESSRFSCEYCGRSFVMSEDTEAHLIPEDWKNLIPEEWKR